MRSSSGSVLITTLACPGAIISVPGAEFDRYGENEHLVDRRRLEAVTVVEQFSQITPEEQRKRANQKFFEKVGNKPTIPPP
jgi:hypothetical protein